MKYIHIVLAALVIATPASPSFAKKAPQMTGLELQQMQARDIEATKDIAFAAVMTVLQDAGYRIGSADRDTGLITGMASTGSKMVYSLWTGFGKSKKTPIVSAYIEARGTAASRVRLNFVMAKVKSTIYGSGAQDEEPILDPSTYQQAFEKINQAVFVRQSMDSQTVVPTAPMSSVPAAPPAPQTGVAPLG